MLRSSDDYVQTQYKSVIDKFKSFCGLDIHIREKPLSKSWEEHGKTIENLGSSLRERGNFRPEHVAKTLKELAARVLSESRSMTSRLQVLVTRTMQGEKSPYSITTPLSGLSGGEVELLMVFCAVFLSGADNVLLDEPGHSLHPPMQAQLRRYLETQRPPGQTCVVVSHSVEFISPQSLRCLYHMSAVGTGFTPFRLLEEKTPDKQSRRNRLPLTAEGGPSDDRMASGEGQSTQASAAGIRRNQSTTASGERSPVPSNDQDPNLRLQSQGAVDGDQSTQENAAGITGIDNTTAPDSGQAPSPVPSNDQDPNQLQSQGAVDEDQSTQENAAEITGIDNTTAPDSGQAPSPVPSNDQDPNQLQSQGAVDGDQSTQENAAGITGIDNTTAPDSGQAPSPVPSNDQDPNQLQSQGAVDEDQSTQENAADIQAESTAASNEQPQSRPAYSSRITVSQNTISMLMKSDMRKMFFATGVYFVEGISDQRVLTAFRHILLKKAHLALEESENVGELYEAIQIQRMDRWDIIPLGGCANAIKAYRAAEALRIPCAFVLDFDAVTSKEDGKIMPFTEAHWKKSTIFKELECLKKALPSATLPQDESSYREADEELARILDEVDEQIFKQNVSEEEGAKKIRELLKNHRIFVWKTDLEGAIFSSEAAAKKIQDILQTEHSSSLEQPSQTMLDLAKGLVKELEGHKKPTREAQKLVKKLWKENQASNTKKKSGGERDELQRRLHDNGGWTRLSWEDLLEVVKSGLGSGKALDELKSFVIQTQSKAEKKEHELPPDVKNRILRSLSRK